MNFLIFQEGILLSLPVLILYFIMKLIRKNFKSVTEEIMNGLMIIYVISFSYFLWFQPGPVLDHQPYNFKPFSTILFYFDHIKRGYLPSSNIIINLMGNVIITMPMGLWLSYKNSSARKALLFAIMLPIFFELGQFILHQLNYATRVIDIDDWLLNAIGILLGFWFVEIVKKWIKHK